MCGVIGTPQGLPQPLSNPMFKRRQSFLSIKLLLVLLLSPDGVVSYTFIQELVELGHRIRYMVRYCLFAGFIVTVLNPGDQYWLDQTKCKSIHHSCGEAGNGTRHRTAAFTTVADACIWKIPNLGFWMLLSPGRIMYRRPGPRNRRTAKSYRADAGFLRRQRRVGGTPKEGLRQVMSPGR
jgi:hypothetical protein